MALLDSGRSSRDILPPINHPDFEKHKSEKSEASRFSIMPGLSISTAPPASPNTIYCGPPPPYSSVSTTADSGHGFSGYWSPPLSNTRRSTRDDKDLSSAKTLPSLPSLQEALGSDKPMPFSGPPSTTQSAGPGSGPSTAVGQTFPDAPRGPPNPFSHTSSSLSFTAGHASTEPPNNNAIPATTTVGPDASSRLAQSYPSSPPYSSRPHRSSAGSFSSVGRPYEPVVNNNNNSGLPLEPSHSHSQFRDYSIQPSVSSQNPPTAFNFEPTGTGKFDDSRNPFIRNNPPTSYSDTVKRHLEVFDAELALNEITDASTRTSDFSRSWAQRYHSSNRSSYFAESAPSLEDIDNMMRHQHRILENFNRIREVVVIQQNLLSEQRARAARGHFEDEYHGLHEEYKTGGFAGGDAKKRRGKAAPPGRCHSCNRAETPEWRRGPDGARTLCNACGLHYAKLTRKMGANKASTITGSNLRPKGLDSRPAHV